MLSLIRRNAKSLLFHVEITTSQYRSCANVPTRVRFAPSPTGELHLGSLRTALFNYLFAKKNGGSFILRIEDTDQERLVASAEQKIEDTLSYFDLRADESPSANDNCDFGPYRQSERLSFYHDAVEQLLDSDLAYKCFCPPERLNILRKKALSEKAPIRYDRHCRKLPNAEITAREKAGEKAVIRFKYDPGEMTFQDTIFGEYSHQCDETDFIIIKQDGFPTYHFANVIDDHHMQISDVIRGMEWLVSTPKHLKLYEAFNWIPPRFAHLPLITKDGQRKLSKRDKDAFVDYYTDLGYLPLALLNFLVRNGSGIKNHKTNNLYTLDEMVENFDVKLIGRSNFMMDSKELDRYGKMAFHEADFEKDILTGIKHQFSLLAMDVKNSINPELLTEDYFSKVVRFLKMNEEAFSKLSDITSGDFRFFFMTPRNSNKLTEYFPNVQATSELLEEFMELGRTGKFSLEELKILAEAKQMPIGNITKLIRLSLLDNVSGPPIGELIEFLGIDEIMRRFSNMLEELTADRRQSAL